MACGQQFSLSNLPSANSSSSPDMTRVLTLLLSSVLVLTSVNSEPCSTEQLTTLAGNKYVAPCTEALGFSEILSLAALSSAQVKMFCANSACMALYDDVLTMDLDNCEITSTGTTLQTDIIDPVTKACGEGRKSTNSTSASSTDTESSADQASSSSTSSSSVATVPVMFINVIGAALAALLL
ncbi:hypothetical protein P3T76_008086 [Phytophthora citrophthora]|uniref:Elicitin n=1 Tax=Phytophthora citrophthora TaxID=4793 RepID=A0AAD9GLH9_9STRA|nr:hypothetical protein P3T76_008086 [Phytophthora citrophthora]